MDALLGAAALGDIGKLFPDSADEFAGISSLELLRRVKLHLAAVGYDVVNIDATILAQAPKLAPYREQMRSNIARELQIDVSRVSVKATSASPAAARGWPPTLSRSLSARTTESKPLRTDAFSERPSLFARTPPPRMHIML